jgi:hypothetical protein
VRVANAIVSLQLAVGGCAVSTDQQRLGYGEYVAFSCDQLGQEAVRLMRETTNRSEHILENDQARRDIALRQLKAVKQASAEKNC